MLKVIFCLSINNKNLIFGGRNRILVPSESDPREALPASKALDVGDWSSPHLGSLGPDTPVVGRDWETRL